MLSIIVAIAENSAIGKNNDLLWHIPEDLKRFKRLTTGHTIIMGKRTFESLPVRPLPNRRSIVITDNPVDQFEGCLTVGSIKEAVEHCNPGEENFIIGGASIYAQFLPVADRLYLTVVHKPFDADVWFPEIHFEEWKLLSQEEFQAGPPNDFSYTNRVYDRIM
ncbi:MAG: dihydrofolate reductase [Bacteroidota bacterium]